MLSYLCLISSDACLHDIQNSTWYQRYIGLPGLPSYPSLPISALFAIISIAVFPLRSFTFGRR